MDFSWRRVGMPVIATSVVAIVALGILVLVVRDHSDGTVSAEAAATSATPGLPSGPCLDKVQFEQVAAELGFPELEGSKVKVTVTTPVVCQDGWVFANTTTTGGGSGESYVLLHHQGKGQWAADAYRSGDTPQDCSKLPAKIRAAVHCP